MSETGGYQPDYSGLGEDPYMAIALQQQLMPEYSVSKGWLPVDQGTVKNQINLNQDLWSNYTDPFQMGYAGALDPRAFQPTYDDSDMPEAPDLAQLELYRNSGDSVMSMIITGLQEGIPPYDVIERLKEEGLIPQDQEVQQADGSVRRVADPRTEALLAEATALQSQVAAEAKYTKDMETYQPKEVPSDLAQQFIDAGLPLPTEQYTPEGLDPELPQLWAGVESAQEERDAYKLETERQRGRRGVRDAKPEEDRSGAWGRVLDKYAGRIDGLTPDKGQKWGRIEETVRKWTGQDPEKEDRGGWGRVIDAANSMHGTRTNTGQSTAQQRMGAQREWIGAANRAANAELAAMLRQAEANSTTRIARAQGRTPYRDAIARAAGPGF